MNNSILSSVFIFLGKWKKLPQFLKTLFFERSKWIRLGIVLVFAGYCFYFVYINLYNPHWSEEKKKEYISTKEKDIVFDARKMESALSMIEKRREKYNSPAMEVEDIFRLNNYSE